MQNKKKMGKKRRSAAILGVVLIVVGFIFIFFLGDRPYFNLERYLWRLGDYDGPGPGPGWSPFLLVTVRKVFYVLFFIIGGILLGAAFPIKEDTDKKQKIRFVNSPPLSSGYWLCSCGTMNGGAFCASCGKPKPISNPNPTAPPEWRCSCGTMNSYAFCANCGKPKPADKAEVKPYSNSANVP